MADVFVDTAGWASFFVTTQPFHKQANARMQAWRNEKTRIVTTNYIVVELVALLTRPLRVPRAQQIEMIDAVRSSDWVDVVHVDATLDHDAWTLLKNRQDKMWSLVDCVGFVLMERHNMRQALTTDHHFEQAGFDRLLK